MNGQGRGMVWLVVALAAVFVVVAAGGAVLVVSEREDAASETRRAEAARQTLADEKRKTEAAERRLAAVQGGGGAGGGSPIGAASQGLAAFRGRHVWVVTRTTPPKDYCATLQNAGLTVRCAYRLNKVKLHVLILRCPAITDADGRAFLKALGLQLRINNWQRENACGKYHEITIYLND